MRENLLENYFEAQNFKSWLNERKMTKTEKKKEGKLHKKTSMEDFVDEYGEEEGKSIYYRTMKRRAMGKGKKKR